MVVVAVGVAVGVVVVVAVGVVVVVAVGVVVVVAVGVEVEMKTILVTCLDAATARNFGDILERIGARVKRNRGRRFVAAVPARRLNDALDILDEADEVAAYEYEL